MVSCLPAVFMRIIAKRLNTRSNSILHADKRTFHDRNVVIPCPDFLYSTLSVDLTSQTTALLFSAPLAIYASLGVYDDHARCVAIANHSNSPLRALIIGPHVSVDDVELEKLYPQTRVLRIPSSTGLLLHRFLMPSPDDYTKLRSQQLAEVKCEVVELPMSYTSVSASSSLLQQLPVKFFLSMVWSPVALVLAGPLLASLFSLSTPHQQSLSFLTLFSLLLMSLLLAVPLVLLTIVLLKKPSYAARAGAMTLSQIKLWKFNTLEAFGDSPSSSPSSSSAISLSALSPSRFLDPYRNLVFFLHGALGLTPSEVQYGGTLTVESQLPPPSFLNRSRETLAPTIGGGGNGTEYLRYDGCYAIDVPSSSLSLSCDWWSITLYGHDLYLLPSPLHRYSINTHQLLNLHCSLITALQSARPTNPPRITYRILCCSEDPKIPPLSDIITSLVAQLDSASEVLYVPVEWIQLVPPEKGEQNYRNTDKPLTESQLEDLSPRFILRGPSRLATSLLTFLSQPMSRTATIG
jgi:hypothetical protein